MYPTFVYSATVMCRGTFVIEQQWLISSTFYVLIFQTNVVSAAFSSYIYVEKAADTTFVQKNLYIKCWWNWHQVAIASRGFTYRWNEKWSKPWITIGNFINSRSRYSTDWKLQIFKINATILKIRTVTCICNPYCPL